MNDLVVVSLRGGLGNQLFQFAAAKGCQADPDRPVVVDTRLEADWPNRLATVLEPTAFRVATSRELLRLRQVPPVPRGQRTLLRGRDAVARRAPALRLQRREFHEAGPIAFDPAIQDHDGPVLLQGYFQSETYFAGVADAVQRSFRLAPAATRRWIDAVTGRLPDDRPIVGVSLRTGADYRDFGVALPRRFADDAIDAITEPVGPVSFVVVGDVPADAAALADHLGSRGAAVSAADAPPADQLHLLAALPHLVLANSSFAWWGAWLGDRAHPDLAERVVVAPDPWWTEPDDIAPARWRRVAHAGFVPAPSEPGAGSRDQAAVVTHASGPHQGGPS